MTSAKIENSLVQERESEAFVSSGGGRDATKSRKRRGRELQVGGKSGGVDWSRDTSKQSETDCFKYQGESKNKILPAKN